MEVSKDERCYDDREDCKNDSYVLCAVSLTIKQIRSTQKLEIDSRHGVSVYVKFLGCKLSVQAEKPFHPIQFHETLELRRVIPCRSAKEAVDYVNMSRCRVEIRQEKSNRIVILAGTEIYGRDFLVSREDDEYETSGMIPLNIIPTGISGSLQKDAIPWVCYSGRVRFTCINQPSYMAKSFKKANLRDGEVASITINPADNCDNNAASQKDDVPESRNFTTLYELMNKKVGEDSPQIRYPLDAFLLYETEDDRDASGQSPHQITLEGGKQKSDSVNDLDATLSSSMCQVSLEDVPSQSDMSPKVDDRSSRLTRRPAASAGPKSPSEEVSGFREKPITHLTMDKQRVEFSPMEREKMKLYTNNATKGQPRPSVKSCMNKREAPSETVPQKKSTTRGRMRRSMKKVMATGAPAKISSSSDSDDAIKLTTPLEKRLPYPEKYARREESPRRTVNLRDGYTPKELQSKPDKDIAPSYPSCMKKTKGELDKPPPATLVHFDKPVSNISPRIADITSSSSSSSLCEMVSNYNRMPSTELKTTRIRTGCNVKESAYPEGDWSPRKWEGSKPSYLEVIENISSKYNPSPLPRAEAEGTYCFVFFVCLLILFCIGVYIWLHKETEIDAKI